MSNSALISIIIVNYNVKEYLSQLLISLRKALNNISHEIYVVDNASVDDSVAYIRQHFPEVVLIENKENLGFGRANNIALKRVHGKYVVMINPDTVVQEDTFEKLLSFFQNHPEAGAATCKILNPDGSFAVDCRHSIPTPMIALWKVLGISKLFPNSKVFAKYNLTYLDPDETYPVPAISGSFMMIQKEALDKIGHFDERFFMYCEDVDLCCRINLGGSKIWYVPTSQIIHYKGESTKKNNVDFVITFNKALYQFFDKYYAKKTLFLFRWLIILGIFIRGVFIYLRNFLHNQIPLILDTIILNGVIVSSFYVWLELTRGFFWSDYLTHYWTINFLSSFIFLIIMYYLEVYPHHRFSILGIIKTNVLTFTLLASLTFFFKQFAFSRMVVLISALISPVLMMSWRGILKRFHRGDKSAWGKDIFTKSTIIVGEGEGVSALFKKIRGMKDMSYELIGAVTIDDEVSAYEENHIPVLGKIENLAKLVSMYRVRQVIFLSEKLTYEKILKAMSDLAMPHLEYKIAPSNLEVMIGKSSIEKLEDYPLVDIEYAIGKPFNRAVKRLFDVCVSSLLLILTTPVMLPVILLNLKSTKRIEFRHNKNLNLSLLQIEGSSIKKPVNLWLKVWIVFRGKLSFVGAPLDPGKTKGVITGYGYKPGITGLVQINRRKILSPDDAGKYHLFYLKNQSILLDLEILFKSIFF